VILAWFSQDARDVEGEGVVYPARCCCDRSRSWAREILEFVK